MNFELWAKSFPRKGTGRPPTVTEHCREVMEAAEAIWDATEKDMAAAVLLDKTFLRTKLRPLFLLSALLHDLGKMNSAFQAILRPGRSRDERQPIRHEILSAMLLADGQFLARWLASALSPQECWLLVWCIAGHHLKMHLGLDGEPPYQTGNIPDDVIFHLGHLQVKDLLERARKLLLDNGREPNVLPLLADSRLDTRFDDDPEGLQCLLEQFLEHSEKAWRQYRVEESLPLHLGLLKALLMAADAAGSALPGEGIPIADWVRSSLSVRVDAESLEPVVQDGHGGKPHDFQIEIANSPTPVTVVMAGTDNGKTTAAYMWAQKWANGRKLFFTYPTTGTASAGYEDYLLEQKHVTSALIHGRALVDLQSMMGTPEDDKFDEWLRLETLRTWERQVIVCTADTVLGLIQNQRRPLYAFPSLAGGAFVFDEIHSYDRRLFGELLTFLQAFPGVPALLMSASIPPGRLDKLREMLKGRMGNVIRGDAELEGHKRYRLEQRDSAAACWLDVERVLGRGNANKVLWVCNRVRDAIELGRDARGPHLAGKRMIYHSRFRYRDRVARQKELIAAFHSEGPVLAITTQVCEMSLDISGNLLATAECPLPALVQRLGRLNRYARCDDPWLCFVYPFRGDPYNEDEKRITRGGDYRIPMTAGRDAVREFGGKPCSQADLAERLAAMVDPEDVDRFSAWLQGGWQTEPLPAREGDTSITVIREEDLTEIERYLGPEDSRNWTSKRLVPWTIPMLCDRRFSFERRVGGYPLAPKGTIAYDTQEGATWQLR